MRIDLSWWRSATGQGNGWGEVGGMVAIMKDYVDDGNNNAWQVLAVGIKLG